MPHFIKNIEAEGILGRFDIYQEFQEGVNVLFGRNGTGKTTLLHILANLLNGDYKRFAFIEFKSIKVQLGDNTDIYISKHDVGKDGYINVTINDKLAAENLSKKEILEQEKFRDERVIVSGGYREKIVRKQDDEAIVPIVPAAYFPAFRTMIEAWASSVEYTVRSPKETQFLSTNLARELFGSFVPNLNYPSPIEIERELSGEIEEALFRVARADREHFGELVPSIFQVLSKNSHSLEDDSSLRESKDILEEINFLVEKLKDYPLKAAPTITQLRSSVTSFQVDEQSKRIAERVLNIYWKALKEVITVQEDSFRGIETYLKFYKFFFRGKKYRD